MNDKKRIFERGVLIIGAALTAIGAVAVAVAIKIASSAAAGDALGAELARQLAADDAQKYIFNAARLIDGADDDDDAAIMALDRLACANSALLRADTSGGREFEAIRALRRQVCKIISGSGNAKKTADIAYRLAEAIKNGNAETVGQLTDELWSMGVNSEDYVFDRGFGALDHATVMTESALREHATSFFGSNAVLSAAGGVAFPPAMTLCGKNLMVSVSRARGQLLELYFDRPAGEERLTADECAEIAAAYAEWAGVDKKTAGDLEFRQKDELCGGRIFADKDGRVVIGVRHDSGRVFYFNAYGYYR